MAFWFKAGLVVAGIALISFLGLKAFSAGRDLAAAEAREILLQIQVEAKTKEVKLWAEAAAKAAVAARADQAEVERLANNLASAIETKDKLINEKNRKIAECLDARDTGGLRGYFEQTDPDADLDPSATGRSN